MASILFVDSPVGSGFSYARDSKGYDVGDYSSSLQIVTFLKQVKISLVGLFTPLMKKCFYGRTVCLNYLPTSVRLLCSGSSIIRSIFRIFSTLVGIRMLERWFHLLRSIFQKVNSTECSTYLKSSRYMKRRK
jgi:hypothetical protein